MRRKIQMGYAVYDKDGKLMGEEGATIEVSQEEFDRQPWKFEKASPKAQEEGQEGPQEAPEAEEVPEATNRKMGGPEAHRRMTTTGRKG